jgi:hypothetical protein
VLRSSAILAKIHAAAGLRRPDAVTPGIYAGGFAINAYPVNDRSNGPPLCSVSVSTGSTGDSDIAVDRQGDLLVPDLNHRNITVYAGPGLCGPKLGTITSPYGEPIDVASRNAANGGKIVVANFPISRYHPRVGISVCTLSGGCTAQLFAGHTEMEGVALAPNGDCWATAGEFTPTPDHRYVGPALAYFAHCRQSGVITTGFQNVNRPFGLDIDDNGNLVVISPGRSASQLYIYSGCNPVCTLVGGPFQLRGDVAFGHLDANSKKLVAAREDLFQLDLYSYSESGVNYEYSITNGLTSYPVGAAFSPPSKE